MQSCGPNKPKHHSVAAIFSAILSSVTSINQTNTIRVPNEVVDMKKYNPGVENCQLYITGNVDQRLFCRPSCFRFNCTLSVIYHFIDFLWLYNTCLTLLYKKVQSCGPNKPKTPIRGGHFFCHII